MTNNLMTQSQKRFEESLGSLFCNEEHFDSVDRPSCLFLKSSSDVGVIRNGGRNGARFAPQSLLSVLKRFSLTHELNEFRFQEIEVSKREEEEKNFFHAQKLEAERIHQILSKKNYFHLFHLGGGHDHVFPLLMALSHQRQKMIVINIDAHADTRTDSDFHSGTPFRQFSSQFSGDFHLFQVGLNQFANSFSTLSPIPKGTSQILWQCDVNDSSLSLMFQQIETLLTKDSFVVFSLDADALNGFEIPGVSAFNPRGISTSELLKIWSFYKKLSLTHGPIVGIYELNPLYDSISSPSMRTIGSFIFECLRTK